VGKEFLTSTSGPTLPYLTLTPTELTEDCNLLRSPGAYQFSKNPQARMGFPQGLNFFSKKFKNEPAEIKPDSKEAKRKFK
jgi:hypothetical protein